MRLPHSHEKERELGAFRPVVPARIVEGPQVGGKSSLRLPDLAIPDGVFQAEHHGHEPFDLAGHEVSRDGRPGGGHVEGGAESVSDESFISVAMERLRRSPKNLPAIFLAQIVEMVHLFCY